MMPKEITIKHVRPQLSGSVDSLQDYIVEFEKIMIDDEGYRPRYDISKKSNGYLMFEFSYQRYVTELPPPPPRDSRLHCR